MKENQNDDLFQLIKSMSRTEKRYFKVDAQKGSSSYIKLFDALNSMDEYDEERLQKKLKGESMLNRLGTEKNYLYYAILKSMRSYWSDKSAYSRIKEMILNANYLLDRGLYEQSGKMLKKAKKLAVEFEQSLAVLEINKMERNIITYLNPKSYKEKIDALIEEKEEVTGLINEEFKYSDYKYQVFSELARQNQFSDEVTKNHIQSKYFLEDEEERKISSIHGLYQFFLGKGIYYKLLGDHENSFRFQEKASNWWELNDNFKGEEFAKYISDLANLIGFSFSNNKHELVPELILKLENVKPNNFHEERIIFENLGMKKLFISLNFGEFDEAKTIIADIEKGLSKFYINKKIRTTLLGNFAVYNFIVEEYDNCIKWIDKIIGNKNVQVRQDVQRYIRVLKVICYYELEEIEKFELSCRSALRYIEKTTSKKQDVFDFFIISFLKKINQIPLSELKLAFQEFFDNLSVKKNNPSNKHLLGLDEYYYWVLSKLEKTPITELIKKDKILKA